MYEFTCNNQIWLIIFFEVLTFDSGYRVQDTIYRMGSILENLLNILSVSGICIKKPTVKQQGFFKYLGFTF